MTETRTKENLHFTARPELRTRLAVINGGVHGYLDVVLKRIPYEPDGRSLTRGFLNNVVLGYKAAPLWLVVVLTRIAEEDLSLTRDNAIALSTAWFTTEED